jgi:gliding motility-associated-like protein
VGGDIYYDYLGNDNYQFNISVYRDCNSTGAQFDNPLQLAVYNSQGFLVSNVGVPFPGSTVLPVVFNNPCVIPPGNICTEVAVYQVVLNLPPAVGGYTISYQRCCRGPNITNLVQPDDTGLTLTCHVPGSDTGANVNSSARFTNYPPLLLCNNEDLIFDHSATDPDGDQLQYSLVTPYAGANSFNPLPNPAPPPPYAPVMWAGGFSAANPLGPGATISIDPNTGLLTASPNMLGLFVVGIKVDEIRNGVVINSTIRDFLFRVFNCQVQLEALLPTQDQLPGFVSYCQGMDIQFANNSYGGTNYEWDFGVPGINTDVSTLFEPSYTYPAPGQYQAMLVVNPGWPCTDTAYIDINVNNELEIEFTSQDSLCIFDNEFDFVASSTNSGNINYTWDFGPTANQQNSTGQTVNGVSFNSTGFIPVTLNGDLSACTATYTDSIYIFPEPVSEIILPNDIECAGYDIAFDNNSQNSVIFEWDFGVQGTNTDVSNQESPQYTYPGPGNYTVTLISGSTPACADTTTADITINEPIIVAFNSEDSLCVTNNSFNFDGSVSGPPNTVYTWNFGPNGSIQSSNNIDEPAVSFNTTGPVTVTLTGTHDGCVETVSHEIYLYSEPTIDFALQPGLQCAPFVAQFVDQSWAETGILYSWDFGDGSTSTEQNPSHLYTGVGNYPVSLTIETTAGCATVLTLTEPDLVNVRPYPEAGFSLSTDYTDICHSAIEFTDQSTGGYSYFYWFDDSTAFSEEQNPAHLYLHDGTHYPKQIVTNEWGCKDTAYAQLYIEPYTFYAPNTFTPDGDEFNNVFLPHAYLGVEEYNMKIYNRWGNLIWESYDLETGWDGTGRNGVLVEDGTYIYKIELESCEPIGAEKIITGHVNVLR